MRAGRPPTTTLEGQFTVVLYNICYLEAISFFQSRKSPTSGKCLCLGRVEHCLGADIGTSRSAKCFSFPENKDTKDFIHLRQGGKKG